MSKRMSTQIVKQSWTKEQGGYENALFGNQLIINLLCSLHVTALPIQDSLISMKKHNTIEHILGIPGTLLKHSQFIAAQTLILYTVFLQTWLTVDAQH